jgi:hypothetical protein
MPRQVPAGLIGCALLRDTVPDQGEGRSAAGTGKGEAEGSNSGRFDYRTKFFVKLFLAAVTGKRDNDAAIEDLELIFELNAVRHEGRRLASNERGRIRAELRVRGFQIRGTRVWDVSGVCPASPSKPSYGAGRPLF